MAIKICINPSLHNGRLTHPVMNIWTAVHAGLDTRSGLVVPSRWHNGLVVGEHRTGVSLPMRPESVEDFIHSLNAVLGLPESITDGRLAATFNQKADVPFWNEYRANFRPEGPKGGKR